MKTNLIVLMALLTLRLVAQAQPALSRDTVRLPEDMVAIRQLADRGSIQAQLALGKKFLANQQPADALNWYLKTAQNDCLDGIHQVGNLMLFGADSPYPDQKVKAEPKEGVKWTFRAATNSYVSAYRNMSIAMQRGLGVKTNLVESYAWMQLYADAEPGIGREALETLSLRFDTDVLVAGRKLAGEFKQGNWPKLKFASLAGEKPPAVLKLTGVTVGGRTPLAVINRRTFGPGESAKVPLANGGTAKVKCLEIRDDSVQVEVEGEDEPRWLQFEQSADILAGQ